jgi:hypothetical protein
MPNRAGLQHGNQVGQQSRDLPRFEQDRLHQQRRRPAGNQVGIIFYQPFNALNSLGRVIYPVPALRRRERIPDQWQLHIWPSLALKPLAPKRQRPVTAFGPCLTYITLTGAERQEKI